MSRFVDQSAVLKVLESSVPRDVYVKIKNLPTIGVPWVTCKECKYADEYNHCAKVVWRNSANDYCSSGERREDA